MTSWKKNSFERFIQYIVHNCIMKFIKKVSANISKARNHTQ